jgi:hypothetical protein
MVLKAGKSKSNFAGQYSRLETRGIGDVVVWNPKTVWRQNSSPLKGPQSFSLRVFT